MRGRVKISLMDEDGREITLSALKGGRFFGEMALFDESPRSADVETFVPLFRHSNCERSELTWLLGIPPALRHVIQAKGSISHDSRDLDK